MMSTVKSASPRQYPPGPPAVGNNPIALLRYLRAITADPIRFVTDRFDRYGDIYYVNFRKSHLYVVRHPDLVREVLVTKGSSFGKTRTGTAARTLERFLGQGLLVSNGDFWKKQRRLINPAFHRKRLAAHAEMMVGHTRDVVESWPDGATEDISRQMMELTLRIVTRALFDHDAASETDIVARAMGTLRHSVNSPPILPWWVPLPSHVRARRAIGDIDDIIYGLIDDRLALGPDELAERNDLLSMLCGMVSEDDSDTTMTRQQLRHELLTLYLAGHETTAHALTWALYLLADHPDAESLLHAEVDKVLAGRDPTLDDLDDLPYTKQIVEEAMRLYPPAFVISRQADEDVVIGDYTVPKGAEVLVWIYVVHRDPRWYPDPEKFDPSRFTPESVGDRPRCSYLPFGAGQRLCIGRSFALMEAQLVLATLARRVRLANLPGHVVKREFAVTLSPRGGLPMQVQQR